VSISRFWAFGLILLAGCSTPKQPEIGMDDVSVPKEFHPSLGWIDETPSHYERYLEMFRRGYWGCIKEYIQDIDYVPKKSDCYANGWLSEIAGYNDGYLAAEKDMQRNLRRFGKARTAKYLKEVWDGGG
jgi:hypothetical protein